MTAATPSHQRATINQQRACVVAHVICALVTPIVSATTSQLCRDRFRLQRSPLVSLKKKRKEALTTENTEDTEKRKVRTTYRRQIVSVCSVFSVFSVVTIFFDSQSFTPGKTRIGSWLIVQVNWGKRRFFVLPWRSLPRSFSFDFTVSRAPRSLTAPALSSDPTTINYQLLAINQPALRTWRKIPCCTDCARAPRYRRQPGLGAAGPRAGPLAVDTELPNPASGGKGLGTFFFKISKPAPITIGARLAPTAVGAALELFPSKLPNLGTFPFKISKHWNFSFKNFQILELFIPKLPMLGIFACKLPIPLR